MVTYLLVIIFHYNKHNKGITPWNSTENTFVPNEINHVLN